MNEQSQIEKYLRGEMPPEEAQQLEKRLTTDADFKKLFDQEQLFFLAAEAVVADQLKAELRSLQKNIVRKKPRKKPIIAYAAIIVLIITAGFFYIFSPQKSTLAVETLEQVIPDSNNDTPTPTDTASQQPTAPIDLPTVKPANQPTKQIFALKRINRTAPQYRGTVSDDASFYKVMDELVAKGNTDALVQFLSESDHLLAPYYLGELYYNQKNYSQSLRIYKTLWDEDLSENRHIALWNIISCHQKLNQADSVNLYLKILKETSPGPF